MTDIARGFDFRDKRHLVTGAAGFIGSHVCAALAEHGSIEVRALDSLLFGNWTNVADEPSIRPHTVDLRDVDISGFRSLLEGVEVLFHFAAQKLNNATSTDDLIATNIGTTHRLIEAAVQAGVRKIVFASSLYAHGRTSLPALREDDYARPDTLYGVTKLAGEGMLRSIRRQTGIETVALRFFFVYGPRQYVGLGYPSVIIKNFERMLRGEHPIVNGSGDQRLDYVFIDDVVEAVLRAASSDISGTFNIGSGYAVSINELTQTMREVAGFEAPARTGAPDWTEGSHRQADTARATLRLGWTASTELPRGLERVWRWTQERDPTC